jgi:hypothetical protein
MTNSEPTDAAPVTLVGWLRGSAGLRPVAKRWPWITCGLIIQAAAVAVVLAWAYRKYKDDAVEGAALKTTVKLIWTDTMHSHTGIAVLACSAVVFAVGSMLLARPYVRSMPMLVVGVPIAAVAGLLVLGAFALVIAVLAALAYAGFEGGSGSRASTTNNLGVLSGGAKKTKEEREQLSAE